MRPLERLANRDQTPIVLVIDAVDEATTYSGKPTIYDLAGELAATANVRVILSTHPGVRCRTCSSSCETPAWSVSNWRATIHKTWKMYGPIFGKRHKRQP